MKVPVKAQIFIPKKIPIMIIAVQSGEIIIVNT
jgi:hypothetical protein